MRPTLEVVAAILKTAEHTALKDHIMHHCTLSTKQFNKTIPWLIQIGLLHGYPATDLHTSGRPTKQRMIFTTSARGIEFLRLYDHLVRYLTPQKVIIDER